MTQEKFKPIAIIGIGAIFPGASNVDQFWRNILNGASLVTPVPSSHWLIEDYYDADPTAIDKTYGKSGAFIPHIDFDPIEFGIPPNNVPAIDTAQLLALIVAKQVLSDTFAEKWRETDLNRTSVILGSSSLEAIQHISGRMQRPIWTKVLRDTGFSETMVQQICDKIAAYYTGWQENTFPGLLSNVVAGRIANRFNLGGTNCTVDAACAGSLAAFAMGVQELQCGTSDMVISGGVDAINDIIMYTCFSKVGALSPTGLCRPFSASADGTVLGEGIGMFALKRLTDAEKDHNKIYAVIKGLGTSSDGRSKSIYAPVAQGQSQAILRAYEMAGFSADTIGLIEAHGTGTRAGDAAELAGLKLAFNQHNPSKKGYCALGSVKSQIGHTKSASGAAGLFKAAMALHHKILPPTINIEKPDPKMNIEETPFYLNSETRPWLSHLDYPRRAGVSSFGFGGSNYHVALEEYKGPLSAPRLRGAFATELIILAAEDPHALKEQCEQLIQADSIDFLSLAQNQQQVKAHLLARLAIVASSLSDLQTKLKQSIAIIESSEEKDFAVAHKDIFYGYGLDPGRVAFLFPGQGSQYVNMGKDVTMAFPQALQQWEFAAHLDCMADIGLAEKVFPIPVFDSNGKAIQEKALASTDIAQPALAVTNLLYLKLLTQTGILADAMVGHSFGELIALFAAQVIDEETVLAMAQKRGALLQGAAERHPGAMLSVLAPAAEVLALIDAAKLEVTAANFNGPQQLVLSGSTTAIEKAELYLQKANMRFVRLAVATAFHSSLVQECQEPFYEYLKGLSYRTPTVDVYANQTAAVYPVASEETPRMLADQIVSPVKFQQSIEKLYESGVRTFIEVGPNSILSGLVKQCLGERIHWAVPLNIKNEHGVTGWWRALAQLFVIGLNPDFSLLWEGFQLQTVKEATKPHALKINGTNYARPYPPSKRQEESAKINVVRANTPLQNEHQKNASPADPIYPARDKVNPVRPAEILRGKTMSQTNNPPISVTQEIQRQLIESHNTYQKTTADAHMTFLHVIGQLGQQVAGIHSTQAAAPSVVQPSVVPPIAPSMPVAPMRPAVAPSPVSPVMPIMAPQPIQESIMPAVDSSKPVASSIAPPPAPAPATRSLDTNEKPAQNTMGFKDFLLETVVNKTGYPREMLDIDMDIEADLGIDSIKRVEIFSTLSNKIPKIAKISPNQLSDFKTLASILSYVEETA